jgi:hypothetical protein
MVASPADPIIARVFGGVVITSNDARGPASYDVHGLRFVFVPAAHDTATYALDVESRDTEAPPFLAQHFKSNNVPFFERWTRLEVIAKLLGYPVLELVKENTRPNLSDENISIRRVDTPTHWVAVGRR